MYEMGIASSLLDTVKSKASEFPQARPSRMGVRVGEWSGVDVEALRYCLEALKSTSDMEGLRVEIDTLQNRHQCKLCGWEFHVNFREDQSDVRCPYCNSRQTISLTGGTELDLSFVELEE